MTRRPASNPPAAPSPATVRRALLAWFRANARELPWRARRDPYRVWVSEVMLQQTRVEAVLGAYQRFLAAFPTIEALAAAQEPEVLARWSGLGYYRRARSLHAGARVVVERHGASLPSSREELERIPGIGAYTAGALLSIAFGRPEPAVDANVARVVARVCGIVGATAGERAAVAEFAGALVRCASPGDVNEALMDLGSAICTARVARCGECPLRRSCRARAGGDPVAIAGVRARKPPRDVLLACAVVRERGRVLFLRRPERERLLAGLWELPTVELADERDVVDAVGARDAGDAVAALGMLVRERAGFDVPLGGPLVEIRHDIVGRRIRAKVYEACAPAGMRRRLPGDARLVAADELEEIGLPALPVKILRALERRPSSPSCAGRAAARR